MAFLKFENVAIRGVSACVPKKVEENKDLPFYAPGEAEQVIASTGIVRRHVANEGITASDLCLRAAEKLIEELKWDKESIDLLAFVTQNPDYVNLPNSFVIHDKLGLSENTACLDFYHGCPGWVVGMSSVSAIISTGNLKRALFLDGDTVTKMQYANDREEYPLFGDAGTATALEYDETSSPMCFNLGTKSDDAVSLIRPYGGYRNPYTAETLQRELDMRSGKISDFSSVGKMDGMDVFSFAITKAPKSLKRLCTQYEIELETIDNLFLHQANKLIIESIAKRVKMASEKAPLSLVNYGNTVAASIPLTMVTERRKELVSKKQRNLACAFGTGLSWGAMYFETDLIVVPEVMYY